MSMSRTEQLEEDLKEVLEEMSRCSPGSENYTSLWAEMDTLGLQLERLRRSPQE